jgi:4-hydroxy-tetrahydrodipicolinate reductase
MKIALSGYGKMGKAIEQIALERGHEIVQKFNSSEPLIGADLSACDIVIDFTRPEVASHNIRYCIDNKCSVVAGTTGWYHNYEALRAAAHEAGICLFTATNFSLGVNIAFHVNRILAAIMSNHREYNAHIEETHHIHKLDAPSGTAITLAEGIVENHTRFARWQLSDGQNLAAESLPIISHRIDEVPGTHRVIYASPIDSIELIHTAFNRQGFALGAVLAAEFCQDKQGVFGMKDLLQL